MDQCVQIYTFSARHRGATSIVGGCAWPGNEARVTGCDPLSLITSCLLPPLVQWDHPSVVMVVYDVTNEQSFASCAKWLERVKAQRPGAEVPLPGKKWSGVGEEWKSSYHSWTNPSGVFRCPRGEQG